MCGSTNSVVWPWTMDTLQLDTKTSKLFHLKIHAIIGVMQPGISLDCSVSRLAYYRSLQTNILFSSLLPFSLFLPTLVSVPRDFSHKT